MFPIWIIARREFTENILSLRLLIGLIVCLALFVASTYVLMEDYEKRLSVHNISIAYDVICGERERGTLALVASNPVSKYHILIGKYLGGMASLLVPLAIGWIAAALLINVNPMIEFHTAEWCRFAGLFAALALYLSVFFLLSMLVSAITGRSARALVWLLFLWIVIVFIIPNGAVYIAKQVRPIPSKSVVNIERAALTTAFWEKIGDYGAKHQSRSYFTSERSVSVVIICTATRNRRHQE
ncbi:MAG: ABC transporter permease subunit [Candidatus Poribacteria bacterium]|nr:ABC transporter permease subunit [Candidatus Poribacteria bacterium]